MKRVYICAPLRGRVAENLGKAKSYMLYALKCGAAPVVPHFFATVLDDGREEERQLGRNAGLSLLWLCDELWVFGEEISEGMKEEMLFAGNIRLPVRRISAQEVLRKLKGVNNEISKN